LRSAIAARHEVAVLTSVGEPGLEERHPRLRTLRLWCGAGLFHPRLHVPSDRFELPRYSPTDYAWWRLEDRAGRRRAVGCRGDHDLQQLLTNAHCR
jgi:hypothetical protein